VDRIIVFNHGRIVETGTYDTLVASQGNGIWYTTSSNWEYKNGTS
jgi:ABC-type multidrug transport system fused ATPase/permease subunit